MSTSTAPVPTTPAPFGDDDPRALFGRAVALASAVLGEVGPDQLDLPTPCTDMDVRRLRRHLVMVLQRVACAGRDEDPMTWPGEPDLADDEVPDAWTAAAHEVQEAWTADALLTRPTRLPWTTLPGGDALASYTNEVTVHTWDLARATGQEPEWDDAVVATSMASITSELPLAERGPIWEAAKAAIPSEVAWEDPFADAVPVADDAPAIDRLVAWNGRRP